MKESFLRTELGVEDPKHKICILWELEDNYLRATSLSVDEYSRNIVEMQIRSGSVVILYNNNATYKVLYKRTRFMRAHDRLI